MSVVEDETALLGPSAWYFGAPAARPAFVTYSFPTAPAPTSPAGGSGYITYFDETLKSYARDALAAWSAVCGITFVETTAHVGDVTFVLHDMSVTGNHGVWGDAPPSRRAGPGTPPARP